MIYRYRHINIYWLKVFNLSKLFISKSFLIHKTKLAFFACGSNLKELLNNNKTFSYLNSHIQVTHLSLLIYNPSFTSDLKKDKMTDLVSWKCFFDDTWCEVSHVFSYFTLAGDCTHLVWLRILSSEDILLIPSFNYENKYMQTWKNWCLSLFLCICLCVYTLPSCSLEESLCWNTSISHMLPA